MSNLKEYMFDATLFAVVRVKAASEQEARQAMREQIDCLDLNKELPQSVRITECSLSDGEQYLAAIDDMEV